MTLGGQAIRGVALGVVVTAPAQSVLGRLLSFGLLGIFVGPLILAVTCMLLEVWVNDEHPPHEPSGR